MKKLPMVLMAFLCLSSCYVPNKRVTKSNNKYNIDSLITTIRQDDKNVKDVFYNPVDSVLNIAVTKKLASSIKDNNIYFIDYYDLYKVDAIDGTRIFVYQPSKKLSGGKYKKDVNISSKRAGQWVEDFKTKFCRLGYCRPLANYIMAKMDDPGSFDPGEMEVYWDPNLYKSFTVEQSFRGKNTFGGIVLNKVEATVDFSGNILSLQKLDE